VFKFHLGTAACGGLIIAVIQWARWMALYVEKHCKGIQRYERKRKRKKKRKKEKEKVKETKCVATTHAYY